MNLQEPLSAYQLGTLLKSTPLQGGLLHNTYHVTTNQGEFVVKALNQDLEQHQHLEATEAIASAAKTRGFPARTAILCHQHPVYNAGNDAYLVYPYLQGHTLSVEELLPHHIKGIAEASARLHQLKLTVATAPAFKPFVIDPVEWSQHLGRFEPLLRTRIPDFLKIYTEYPSAFERLKEHTLISHRDFTPSNLLWQDESHFTVIDWELAGLINPEFEMLNNAMDVAITAKTVKLTHFFDYLKAYRAVMPERREAPRDLIHACLGSWIHWILFCLKRHNHHFKPIETEKILKTSLIVIDFLLENTKNIELALLT